MAAPSAPRPARDPAVDLWHLPGDRRSQRRDPGAGPGSSPGARRRLWDIEVSREVEVWYGGLGPRERAHADRAFDRLAERGPELRMPHSRTLGRDLHALRFSCDGVQRRVTYAFGSGRGISALTTFRKQRDRERHEIERARKTLTRDRERARTPQKRIERER